MHTTCFCSSPLFFTPLWFLPYPLHHHFLTNAYASFPPPLASILMGMIRTLTAQIMLANLSPHLPSSLLFLAGYPYFVPTFNFHFIDCGFKMLLLLVVLLFVFPSFGNIASKWPRTCHIDHARQKPPQYSCLFLLRAGISSVHYHTLYWFNWTFYIHIFSLIS